MTKVAATIQLLLGLFPALAAQEQPPVFEVASIKLVDPNADHFVGVQVFPGGRVVLNTLSLRALVQVAFNVSPKDLISAEPWMAKDEYNIEAVPVAEWREKITNLQHGNYDIQDEHLRQMLQGLLVDRFQLKFHQEAKAGTVYLLKRTALPLRLQPSQAARDAEKPSPFLRGWGDVSYAGGRWSIYECTMARLAKFAGDVIVRAKAVDQTGLDGSFNYRQKEPDLNPDYYNPSESFLRMISDVGLKLERTQGEITVLVIDSAQKPSN